MPDDRNPAPAPPIDPKDDSPGGLLRRFVVLSAISVVTILVLVAAGVHQAIRVQVIESSRAQAVAVATAILAKEKSVLVRRDEAGLARIAVADGDMAGLDARLKSFLAPFDIVKIKVYDGGRVIVHSTDAAIIGKHDAGNGKLERVLRDGEVDSALVKKDRIADLDGIERFVVDVVETYVPIRVDGRVAGALEVYLDVTPAYGRLETAVMRSVLVLLAVLLAVFGALYWPMRQGTARLERAQARLRELASTDMLTGLLNRRHLLARIDEELRRLGREMRRTARVDHIAFVMIDVDHFKAINDRHGHVAGDEVLREVSRRLKASLRAYDTLGRYGGEEFLALLPGTELASAVVVAERMRRAVADEPFVVAGQVTRVTASFGVAQSGDEAEAPDAVIQRADAALYRAKSAGRDRVEARPADEG
ncbi:MAG TPA: GGDEF domain-containing protein [Usitatibacteraceae bacterium]|jgi:diguanylate cyclase (GGDEF)-like protein|nr:GGDEF domain-containing protein [Usitatibacteraceae bacterium]